MKFLALLSAFILSVSAASASDTGLFFRSDPTTIGAPVDGKTVVFNTTTRQFNVYDGTSGTYQSIGSSKSNLNASVGPTVNDDNTEGYTVGSIWAQPGSNGFVYICLDNSTGAAYWSEFDQNLIFTTVDNAIDNYLPLHLETADLFSDWLVYGLELESIPGPLTQTISNGILYTNGFRTIYAGETYTYPTFSDTYEYMDGTGTFTRISVANGNPAPTTPGGILVQIVSTDGSGVTGVVSQVPSLPTMNVGTATAGTHAISMGQADSRYAPSAIATTLATNFPAHTWLGNPSGSAALATPQALTQADIPLAPLVVVNTYPYQMFGPKELAVVALSANETVNLPDATTLFDITLRLTANSNVLTIMPFTTGQLIDGNASLTETTSGTLRFISDGAGNVYEF